MIGSASLFLTNKPLQQPTTRVPEEEWFKLKKLKEWKRTYSETLRSMASKQLIAVIDCSQPDAQGLAAQLIRTAEGLVDSSSPLQNSNPIQVRTAKVRIVLDRERDWGYLVVDQPSIQAELDTLKMMIETAVQANSRELTVLVTVTLKDLNGELNRQYVQVANDIIKTIGNKNKVLVAIDCSSTSTEGLYGSLIERSRECEKDSATLQVIRWIFNTESEEDAMGFQTFLSRSILLNDYQPKFNALESHLVKALPKMASTAPYICRSNALTAMRSRLQEILSGPLHFHYREVLSACQLLYIRLYLNYKSRADPQKQVLQFLNNICSKSVKDLRMEIDLRTEEIEFYQKEGLQKTPVTVIKRNSQDFELNQGLQIVQEDLEPGFSATVKITGQIIKVREDIRPAEGIFRATYRAVSVQPDTELILEFRPPNAAERQIRYFEQCRRMLSLEKDILENIDAFPSLKQLRSESKSKPTSSLPGLFDAECKRLLDQLIPPLHEREALEQALEFLRETKGFLGEIKATYTSVLKHEFLKTGRLWMCACDHHIIENPMRLEHCRCEVSQYIDQACLVKFRKATGFKCQSCQAVLQPTPIDHAELQAYRVLLSEELDI